jgi:sRNA-binding carbon storage regulator CsrA
MRFLTLVLGEAVHLGDLVTVTLIDIDGGSVVIGIDAAATSEIRVDDLPNEGVVRKDLAGESEATDS